MQPWEIIAELEKDNSRLAKEAIVLAAAQSNNDTFFWGCQMSLDAMVTFGVKRVDLREGDGPGLSWEGFKNIADKLANRTVTGNLAQQAVNTIRIKATAEQWNNWYRRILIKDLRCGLSEKTINKVVEKTWPQYAVQTFNCQLAHDSANHESRVSGTKLIEVKLDGVRVITVAYPDGTVNQYSRNGKELVNFEHIKQQIGLHSRFFAEPVVLDGEIMSASFQDLMKQVHRKSDVNASDAVLNLFDVITLREFQAGRGQHRQIDRSVSLKAWYDEFADHMDNVTVVGQELVDLDSPEGQQRFKAINADAIAGGYEGIMIKDPQAVYECKRSVNWLKLKPFIEVSLEVTDVEEGTGRNQGRLGALVCYGYEDSKHIAVNVGSGFSDSDRDTFYRSRDSLIGQIVEVRADAITQNQDGSYSLRFPRFLRFRGFEPGEKI